MLKTKRFGSKTMSSPQLKNGRMIKAFDHSVWSKKLRDRFENKWPTNDLLKCAFSSSRSERLSTHIRRQTRVGTHIATHGERAAYNAVARVLFIVLFTFCLTSRPDDGPFNRACSPPDKTGFRYEHSSFSYKSIKRLYKVASLAAMVASSFRPFA